MNYAELHCISNFTFLRGASHPEELVERAIELGYRAIALTDECSLAGVVRAHEAAQDKIQLIIGSEFRLLDGAHIVVLPMSRLGYGCLTRAITRARRNAEKGRYTLDCAGLAPMDECLAIMLPEFSPSFESQAARRLWLNNQLALLRRLAPIFENRLWIGAELLADYDDGERIALLRDLGTASGFTLVASGDVHMHVRSRRALQDTLTAIRLRLPLSEAGYALHANGERHLRSLTALEALYPPEWLAETLTIAALCKFSLSELRYEYPDEIVPAGQTPGQYLRHLTEQGAARRWPEGVPAKVRALIESELKLIGELAYEPYFLTVYDIVQFARSRGILCQGRGSAANSVVCYCLEITAVNPAQVETLVERFISKERNEPPDIDVDFEHERREEVMQYVYRKYGRERAGLAATLITYRVKSALRDVGKALGLSLEQVDRLAKSIAWWEGRRIARERLLELGFDPEHPLIVRLMWLVSQLIGFPRHLSQHVGGFVIARGLLSELVPIENAAMPERTIIQWEKDDLASLGLLKVDCLALGMLSAIRRSVEYINAYRGSHLTLASIPTEDPQTYAMIQKADTVGVFQIESRAQMAMLPRLKPLTYYDLVIQVAIVRPGPIQGGMVHPYLRRREKQEAVEYPNPEIEAVLGRTLGVPIFQEQVIKLSTVAAGFTPGEADGLRRAMAAWRRRGGLEYFEQRLRAGMRERGYPDHFAEAIFRQILGFGEYGFPESHAASFALLAYVSAWLKCHEPAAFTCGLLNSQPMGFYAPSQLVQDARRHGVEVRPVDVRYSDYDCTLEARETGQPALRLGLRMIQGVREASMRKLVAARKHAPFVDTHDVALRSGLPQPELKRLAAADALAGLSGHRHTAFWEVAGVQMPMPLFDSPSDHSPPLKPPSEAQEIVADYAQLGLTLRRHPLELLRPRLRALRLRHSEELRQTRDGAWVRSGGLVITRQHPGGAGVIFLTIEDEFGTFNVIIWRDLVERFRKEILGARLLEIRGRLQRQHDVLHLIADDLIDRTRWLGRLATVSRDFC